MGREGARSGAASSQGRTLSDRADAERYDDAGKIIFRAGLYPSAARVRAILDVRRRYLSERVRTIIVATIKSSVQTFTVSIL